MQEQQTWIIIEIWQINVFYMGWRQEVEKTGRRRVRWWWENISLKQGLIRPSKKRATVSWNLSHYGFHVDNVFTVNSLNNFLPPHHALTCLSILSSTFSCSNKRLTISTWPNEAVSYQNLEGDMAQWPRGNATVWAAVHSWVCKALRARWDPRACWISDSWWLTTTTRRKEGRSWKPLDNAFNNSFWWLLLAGSSKASTTRTIRPPDHSTDSIAFTDKRFVIWKSRGISAIWGVFLTIFDSVWKSGHRTGPVQTSLCGRYILLISVNNILFTGTWQMWHQWLINTHHHHHPAQRHNHHLPRKRRLWEGRRRGGEWVWFTLSPIQVFL